MKLENIPNWLPSGDRDFVAEYQINFYTDLNHQIICGSYWQSVHVKSNTLFVNNIDNQFDITFKSGASTEVIPANSQGYISLYRKDSFILTSPFPCFLLINLMTELRPPGFTGRGNSPSYGLDPLFNRVIGLYHFSGANGDVIATDFSGPGFGNLTFKLPSAISERYSKFSNSSGVFTFSGFKSAVAPNSVKISNALCVEFWIAVDTLNANHNLFTIAGSSFDIVNAFGNFYINGFSTTTSAIASAKNSVYADYYHVAFQVYNGQSQAWVNGVKVGALGAFSGYDANGVLEFNTTSSANVGPGVEGYYLNEFRVTNAIRYDLSLASIPVPTVAFLDN